MVTKLAKTQGRLGFDSSTMKTSQRCRLARMAALAVERLAIGTGTSYTPRQQSLARRTMALALLGSIRQQVGPTG